MKKIFLLCLLFSVNSFAQRTLNSQSFQANVRPVLSGILSDFYQMVSLFPDFPQELTDVVQLVDDLNEGKELIRINCPRVLEGRCLNFIQTLQTKLSAIDRKILHLKSQQKISSTLHLTSLSGIRVIGEVQTKATKVNYELANSSLLLKAKIPHKRETMGIIKELDELNTLISLSIVEFIPYLYKEDFRHFYFNFIHPIQLQIYKTTNYEFLNRNISDLNFAVNLLNMNLTKRNKKTPEGMAPYLALIHNRWNSLLRFYF